MISWVTKTQGMVAVERLKQAYLSGELRSIGDTWCIKRDRRDKPFIGKLYRQECSRFPCPKLTTSAFDAVVLKGGLRMTFAAPTAFDPAAFLASAGLGRRIVELKPKQAFFSQGDPADSVFYLQKGRAKVTVVSTAGKEATVTLLVPHEFVGEEALSAVPGLRLSTATAITACSALKISREEMIRVMHSEHQFSDLFVKFLLARSMRSQADLVDQLFNSSEKRLARILLLMAEYGEPGEPETQIPPISQETLAEMIGTTRSRVSFFMNRFRRLGFVEYNGRIQVHKSLLKVVLHDRMPDDNAVKPGVLDAPKRRSNPDKAGNGGHKRPVLKNEH
jgi:CRP/FNR family cyclic AMP-dependent transcriptional regulator